MPLIGDLQVRDSHDNRRKAGGTGSRFSRMGSKRPRHHRRANPSRRVVREMGCQQGEPGN
jgi:hypothetical protein